MQIALMASGSYDTLLAAARWSEDRALPVLGIPDHYVFSLDESGIANPAHPDHKWQLRRFMKSPASDPYRLQERKRCPRQG